MTDTIFRPFNPGTISIEIGSTALIGDGTDFTHYGFGDVLFTSKGVIQIGVPEPEDEEHSTTAVEWWGTEDLEDEPYIWFPASRAAFLAASIREFMEGLGDTLKAALGTADARDDYDSRPAGFLYFDIESDPFRVYRKASNTPADWAEWAHNHHYDNLSEIVDNVPWSMITGAPTPVGGECCLYLDTVSGKVKLVPYGGNTLVVDGVRCTIPDDGLELAATGLTPLNLYHIYVTASGGVCDALVASATPPEASLADHNRFTLIEDDDDTKSFVGSVIPIAGPAFADSPTQRFVMSQFNPKGYTGARGLSSFYTASRTTTSTTYVALHATEGYFEWIARPGQIMHLSAFGGGFHSDGHGMWFNIAVDGVTTRGGYRKGSSLVGTFGLGLSTFHQNGEAIAYHYAQLMAACTTAGAGGGVLGTASSDQTTVMRGVFE